MTFVGCASAMNIAVVSSYNASRSINRFAGGAEVYSLKLAIKLAELKNKVTLFIGSEESESHNVNDNLTIKYIRVLEVHLVQEYL